MMLLTKVTDIPKLPPRAAEAHKGSFGKVLVLAGSRDMPGSAALTANGALRSGSGLVRVATALPAQQTVAALAPCATTIGLPADDAGHIDALALERVTASLAENDALALGPGLGVTAGLQRLLVGLLRAVRLPLVIDADGLNNLAAQRRHGLPLPANTVITPHPGEFQRLWRAWLREPAPPQRDQQAAALARCCGAVVVLKGADTVVSDGNRVYVNGTGNPGMATAGAGDVLTGCVASLLGQGLAPFEAAVLGVHVHGLAGDIAAAEHGMIGMVATDIAAALPAAWQAELAD